MSHLRILPFLLVNICTGLKKLENLEELYYLK